MALIPDVSPRAALLGLVTLGLLSAAAATPAFADTKDDLEKQGYKCEVVSTNFWSCTKAGAKEKWCDAGSCQDAPKLQGGGGSTTGGNNGGKKPVIVRAPIVDLPARGLLNPASGGSSGPKNGGRTSSVGGSLMAPIQLHKH